MNGSRCMIRITKYKHMFVKACFLDGALEPLYAQICWQIGVRIDAALLKGRRQGCSLLDCEVRMSSAAGSLHGLRAEERDARLTEYLFSSVEKCRGNPLSWKYLTLCRARWE